MSENKDKDKDLELITSNGDNKNEKLTELREKFKTNYVMKKGWDINILSEEQITEIKSQKGYQCPGMICG